MRFLSPHGILLLAVMGTGASSSGASSSQSTATSGTSSAGAEADDDADLSDSQPDEPNDSFTDPVAVASQAWSSPPADLGSANAPSEADRGSPCFLKTAGIRGACMDASACRALGGHMSTPRHCQGPANIECCTREPHVEDHPPPGWKPVPQTHVTTEMAAWAAMIVESSATYPFGSTTKQFFGAIVVMARVEWHAAHPGHGVVHRGVTLYQPG